MQPVISVVTLTEKLSPALRVSLCIKKGTDLNTLTPDHPYSSHISEQQESEGIGTSLLGCPKIKYCQAQFQLASSVPVNLN